MEKARMRQRLEELKRVLVLKKEVLHSQNAKRAKIASKHVKQKIEEHNKRQSVEPPRGKTKSEARVHFISSPSQDDCKGGPHLAHSKASDESLRVFSPICGSETKELSPYTEKNSPAPNNNRETLNALSEKIGTLTSLRVETCDRKPVSNPLMTTPDSQDGLKQSSALKATSPEHNSTDSAAIARSGDTMDTLSDIAIGRRVSVSRSAGSTRRKSRAGQNTFLATTPKRSEELLQSRLIGERLHSDGHYNSLSDTPDSRQALDNLDSPSTWPAAAVVSEGGKSISSAATSNGCPEETGTCKYQTDVELLCATEAKSFNHSDSNKIGPLSALTPSVVQGNSCKIKQSEECELPEGQETVLAVQSIQHPGNMIDASGRGTMTVMPDPEALFLPILVRSDSEAKKAETSNLSNGCLDFSQKEEVDTAIKKDNLVNVKVSREAPSVKQKRPRRLSAILDFSFLDDGGDMYSQIKSRRTRRSRYSCPDGSEHSAGSGSQLLDSYSMSESQPSQSQHQSPAIQMPRLNEGLSQSTKTKTGQDTHGTSKEAISSEITRSADLIKENGVTDTIDTETSYSKERGTVGCATDWESAPTKGQVHPISTTHFSDEIPNTPQPQSRRRRSYPIRCRNSPALRNTYKNTDKASQKTVHNFVDSKSVILEILDTRITRLFPPFPVPSGTVIPCHFSLPDEEFASLLKKPENFKAVHVKQIQGLRIKIPPFSLPDHDYCKVRSEKVKQGSESSYQPTVKDAKRCNKQQKKSPSSNPTQTVVLSPIAKVPPAVGTYTVHEQFTDAQNVEPENLDKIVASATKTLVFEEIFSNVLNDAILVETSVCGTDQEGTKLQEGQGREHDRGRRRQNRSLPKVFDSCTNTAVDHNLSEFNKPTETSLLLDQIGSESSCSQTQPNTKQTDDSDEKAMHMIEPEKCPVLGCGQGMVQAKYCNSIQIYSGDEKMVSIRAAHVTGHSSPILACCSLTQVYLWAHNGEVWHQLHTWPMDSERIGKLHLVALQNTITIIVQTFASRGAAVFVLGYTRDIQWQFVLHQNRSLPAPGQVHCCSVTPREVCVIDVQPEGSQLTKYTLNEDLMTCKSQLQLQQVSEEVNSLVTMRGQNSALLGSSDTTFYIWNHERGQVLVKIPVSVPVSSCFHCQAEQGLVFVWVATSEVHNGGCLVVANPQTTRAAVVQTFQSPPSTGNSQRRWEQVAVHDDYIVGSRHRQVAVWEAYSGQLEATIVCQHVTCVTGLRSTQGRQHCYVGRPGVVDIYDLTRT